jgi:WD40 repeat protein
MIFPRRPRPSNALAAVFVALSLFGGCATRSADSLAPAAVIEDAHPKGQTLAFDPEAAVLASAGTDGWVRLWRLPDGAPLGGFRAHAGSIYGLEFVAGGREILTAGYDGRLARFERDGRLVRERQTGAPITDLALDARAELVFTGHADGAVRTWRLTDLALLGTPVRHAGKVLAVAYHPGGPCASSGADGSVILWRLGEAPPRRLPPPPTDAVDLAFSPDGRALTGGGWFRLFRWTLPHGTLSVIATPHHGLVRAVAYSPDGRWLASISRHTDSAVYLHDPASGTVTHRLAPHELCGGFVRFSPGTGRYLATTSDDASVRIWTLE